MNRVEGLNSLFYEIEDNEYQKTTTMLTVDIRPLIPTEQKIYLNNQLFYSNKIGPQKDTQCTFKKYVNVSNSDNTQMPITKEWLIQANNITTNEQYLEKLSMCEHGNLVGDGCNAIDNLGFIQMPFPLMTRKAQNRPKAGVRSPTVTVRNCPDNFGLFHTLDDIVIEKRGSSQHLKFEYTSKILQVPRIFLTSYRVWYEGHLIRDCFQYLKPDETKSVQDHVGIEHRQFEKDGQKYITITREDTFENFLPGMYFIHEVVQDSGAQPVLEKYTIFRAVAGADDEDPAFRDLYYRRGASSKVVEMVPEEITKKVISKPVCSMGSKKRMTLPRDYVRMEFKNYVEQYLESEIGRKNYPDLKDRVRISASMASIQNF